MKHTDNCGQTGRPGIVSSCRLECRCWCHRVTKFLVISYDDDEQQTFWDWVLAVDDVKAKAFIEIHRPYVDAVTDVFTVENLRDALRRLEKAQPADIIEPMRELVAQYKEGL